MEDDEERPPPAGAGTVSGKLVECSTRKVRGGAALTAAVRGGDVHDGEVLHGRPDRLARRHPVDAGCVRIGRVQPPEGRRRARRGDGGHQAVAFVALRVQPGNLGVQDRVHIAREEPSPVLDLEHSGDRPAVADALDRRRHRLRAAEVEQGVGPEERGGSSQRRRQRPHGHLVQFVQHRGAVVAGVGHQGGRQVGQARGGGAPAGPQLDHTRHCRLDTGAVTLEVGDEHLLAQDRHLEVGVAGGASRRLRPLQEGHDRGRNGTLLAGRVRGNQHGDGLVEQGGGQSIQPSPQDWRGRRHRGERDTSEDLGHQPLIAIGQGVRPCQVAMVHPPPGRRGPRRAALLVVDHQIGEPSPQRVGHQLATGLAVHQRDRWQLGDDVDDATQEQTCQLVARAPGGHDDAEQFAGRRRERRDHLLGQQLAGQVGGPGGRVRGGQGHQCRPAAGAATALLHAEFLLGEQQVGGVDRVHSPLRPQPAQRHRRVPPRRQPEADALGQRDDQVAQQRSTRGTGLDLVHVVEDKADRAACRWLQAGAQRCRGRRPRGRQTGAGDGFRQPVQQVPLVRVRRVTGQPHVGAPGC